MLERLKAKGQGVAKDEMVDGITDSMDVITDSMDMSLNKLWETVRDREVCHATIHGVPKRWTQLSD